MRGETVAVVAVVALLVGAGAGYIIGTAAVRTTTSVSTYTTTATSTRNVTTTVTEATVTESTVTKTLIGSYAGGTAPLQFVGATVGDASGGGVSLNATYRNTTPSLQQASVVGVAYPANVSYFTGYPVCCSLVNSYSPDNSVASAAAISLAPSSTGSTVVGFSSLPGSTYWVELLATSSNGTALSPLASLFLETASAPGAGGKACGGQAAPRSLFADPDNGEVYVGDSGTDAVSVLNASNANLLATISLPAGASPSFLLYIPKLTELYIGSTEVYAINTTTNTIVSAQPVAGGRPLSLMLYDPQNGLIYGSYYGNDGIIVVNASTSAYVNSIGTVGDAVPVAYSPANGEVYLQGTGTVYALAPDSPVKIQVPDQLSTLIFDQDNRMFYAVANDTLFMINPLNDTLLTRTWALPPAPGNNSQYIYQAVAYDPANKDLYVFGMAFGGIVNAQDKLIAVDTSSGSLVAEFPVQGFDGGIVGAFSPSFTYVPLRGELWATDLNYTTQKMVLVVISGNNSATYRNLSGLYFTANAVLDPEAGVVVGIASPNGVVSVDAATGSVAGTETVGSCSYSAYPY